MQRRASIVHFVCAAIACAIAASGLADINPLLAKANAWTDGQPMPQELLTFHDFKSCLADGSETTVVFSEITNYYFLRAILVETSDDLVFECAVARALTVVGPTRFFHDTEEMYATTPELLEQPRHRELHERARIPHVLVDGIFVSDADMSHEEMDSVFARISGELRAGQLFDAVLRKYQDAYEYAYTETRSDGAMIVLHRTRVGNYGDFVVSEAAHTARPLRTTNLPAEHVRPLLRGRKGDVIVLRHDSEHEAMLYCIRDAYSPKRPK